MKATKFSWRTWGVLHSDKQAHSCCRGCKHAVVKERCQHTLTSLDLKSPQSMRDLSSTFTFFACCKEPSRASKPPFFISSDLVLWSRSVAALLYCRRINILLRLPIYSHRLTRCHNFCQEPTAQTKPHVGICSRDIPVCPCLQIVWFQ